MNTRIRSVSVLLGMMFVADLSLAEEQPGQVNEEQVKAVMQYAQEVQACMGKMDESEVQKMQEEGSAHEAEVRKLCAAGQRDEAQAKAIAYSKDLLAKPTVQQMQQCLKDIKKPQMPGAETEPNPIIDFTELTDNEHICDSLSAAE